MDYKEAKTNFYKQQFEKCVAAHETSEDQDGNRILRIPLPEITKPEYIKVQLTSRGAIRITWTPNVILEGVTTPLDPMVYPKDINFISDEDHDSASVSAKFENGVLTITAQPLRKPSPTPPAILQNQTMDKKGVEGKSDGGAPMPQTTQNMNRNENESKKGVEAGSDGGVLKDDTALKTKQRTDRGDQSVETAKRRAEEESGGSGLEDGRTKSKSMGKEEEEERHTRIPAAAPAATTTEIAAGYSAAAAAYFEGAKELIRTHRREMVTVAMGLAILGISIYVITGRRHD
ncbi:unnamed protein product [Cuscuta epithymum]|uniref:SHSP domain-containing protein n=2 Tax=Cuscuta epithymum TaxID=186058 RepID=A0AAV0DUD4_9ASTE|nr:unnamed protein product [Cuscuta epithymum]